MSQSPIDVPVVLYRYDSSPFSVKVDNLLLLKNIAHRRVNVSPMLPRPEISSLLGIEYRRIPILAIGSDVYCDTSLIASTLERRFPTSGGYGTIFPPRKNGGTRDTGLIKAFSKHYADTVLFGLAVPLIQWDKLPSVFVKDRSALVGGPINVEAMVAAQPKSFSLLSTHLTTLEEQLADGRDWLFDTETPSLADISVQFVLAWTKAFPNTGPLFDSQKFPNVLKWIARVTSFLQEKKQNNVAVSTVTSGADAAALISSDSFEPYEVVGFDTLEATRLDLEAGSTVAIAPDDTGKTYPTIGKLVGLNHEEFVIETKGSESSAVIRVHFPRLAYTAKVLANTSTNKL